MDIFGLSVDDNDQSRTIRELKIRIAELEQNINSPGIAIIDNTTIIDDGGTIISDHGGLDGLDDDDHSTIYYNKSTIDATFTDYSLTADLNISNWDTAYAWGDHSTEGYLTTVAHGDLTGIGASDHHTKYTDAEAISATSASYLPLSGGTLTGDLNTANVTVDGTFIFDSQTDTRWFYITRLGSISESLRLGVDDNFVKFVSIQDENGAPSGITFDVQATNGIGYYLWYYNSVQKMKLDYNGNLDVSGDLTVDGDLNVDGDLAINGKIDAVNNAAEYSETKIGGWRTSGTCASLGFYGKNSAGVETAYAYLHTSAIDATDGSEDGSLRLYLKKAGVNSEIYSFTNAGLGINDATPSYSLDINGTFRATGSTYLNWGAVFGGTIRSDADNVDSLGTDTYNWADIYVDMGSDAGTTVQVLSNGKFVKASSNSKYKENCELLDMKTELIYDLIPYTFNYINGSVSFSYMADDVAQIIPEIVNWSQETEIIDGAKSFIENTTFAESYDTNRLVVMMIEEMKKLRDRISVLENPIVSK